MYIEKRSTRRLDKLSSNKAIFVTSSQVESAAAKLLDQVNWNCINEIVFTPRGEEFYLYLLSLASRRHILLPHTTFIDISHPHTSDDFADSAAPPSPKDNTDYAIARFSDVRINEPFPSPQGDEILVVDSVVSQGNHILSVQQELDVPTPMVAALAHRPTALPHIQTDIHSAFRLAPNQRIIGVDADPKPLRHQLYQRLAAYTHGLIIVSQNNLRPLPAR